jgi:hypothetical protein
MPGVVVTQNSARTGGYIVSEANGYRSREAILIAAPGAALQPGTVVGKITATGKYAALNTAASDGSQNAAGVIYMRVNASTTDVAVTAHVRDCEVNGNVLIWPAGINNTQKNAAISSLSLSGMIVRS